MAERMTKKARRVLLALVQLGKADIDEIAYEAECDRGIAREHLNNMRDFKQWVCRCENGKGGRHQFDITHQGRLALGPEYVEPIG